MRQLTGFQAQRSSPEDLYQTLKHTHHKTPTLEEITHKFSNVTVFSKMDAKISIGHLDDTASVVFHLVFFHRMYSNAAWTISLRNAQVVQFGCRFAELDECSTREWPCF